jgi:hypothetical protein
MDFRKGPLDRFRILVALTDVAHDFAPQVRDRTKNSARGHIAFDFAESEFDLVQPGRVGRRVVNAHILMPSEKFFDTFGLMRRKIVGDDVNLAMTRLKRSIGGIKLPESEHSMERRNRRWIPATVRRWAKPTGFSFSNGQYNMASGIKVS